MPDFWTIFVAAIGFGAAGEGLRRYRQFKAARRTRPPHLRNGGFWTDSRVAHAEAIFAAMAMAIPFTGITLAVWTNNRIEFVYAALLAYAVAVYLLIVALNLPASSSPPAGRS